MSAPTPHWGGFWGSDWGSFGLISIRCPINLRAFETDFVKEVRVFAGFWGADVHPSGLLFRDFIWDEPLLESRHV